MEGNIVTAAKWLGGSMIVASAILVGGSYWVLGARMDRLTQAGPAQAARSEMPSHVTEAPTEAPIAAVARAEQLLKQSEGLRLTGEEWEKFWFMDQPSHTVAAVPVTSDQPPSAPIPPVEKVEVVPPVPASNGQQP